MAPENGNTDPRFTQRDSSKEYNQLRPRSLRSDGTDLDEAIGEIQDVSKDLRQAAQDIGIGTQPIEMMSERTDAIAKKTAPRNALKEQTYREE